MDRAPYEVQVIIAENLEDLGDLRNLRFVNRAMSEGAAKVLFRHLTYTVSPPGLLSLLNVASSRYAHYPRSLALEAPPRRPHNVRNFLPDQVVPIALQRYATVVSRLRNIEDFFILLGNNLIEHRRVPGDRTHTVFWTLVNAICGANRGPSAYINTHLKLGDHMTLTNDAIWPAPGRSNYQQWVSRLVDLTIDTEHLCHCLRHQVCLTDHFALRNNTLRRFEIEINGTSWFSLQKGMFVPPRHQYQLTGLMHVKLNGVICTSRDLLGFLEPSRDTLETLELTGIALAGIEGWQVGMSLPGACAAVLASRWKYAFDNLRENFPNLTKFMHLFLAVTYREGTEWWPNGVELYTPTAWLMSTFVSRRIDYNRIAQAQEGDESALGKLLNAVALRSRASKQTFSRGERRLMRLAELAPEGRRILPARAERAAARERMGRMT